MGITHQRAASPRATGRVPPTVPGGPGTSAGGPGIIPGAPRTVPGAPATIPGGPPTAGGAPRMVRGAPPKNAGSPRTVGGVMRLLTGARRAGRGASRNLTVRRGARRVAGCRQAHPALCGTRALGQGASHYRQTPHPARCSHGMDIPRVKGARWESRSRRAPEAHRRPRTTPCSGGCRAVECTGTSLRARGAAGWRARPAGRSGRRARRAGDGGSRNATEVTSCYRTSSTFYTRNARFPGRSYRSRTVVRAVRRHDLPLLLVPEDARREAQEIMLQR